MTLLQKDGDLIGQAVDMRIPDMKRAHDRQCSLKVGPLKLDYHDHVVFHSKKKDPIELTRMEFKLLELLMRNADKGVARDVILSSVWNVHWDLHTNRVEVLISQLRNKIGAEFIASVRCWGYRFDGGRAVS